MGGKELSRFFLQSNRPQKMIANQVARRIARPMSKRCISFKTENKIAEIRQKYYMNPATGAENPTYLKEGGDKAVMGAAVGGMTFGLGIIFYGLYSMSFGINKV